MAATVGIIMLIAALALLIFCVAVMWKVFCKAGEPGWASLIPFYNIYVMTRITWGRGWLFIFTFLPLGNLIFGIFTSIKLAKVFGKKGGIDGGSGNFGEQCIFEYFSGNRKYRTTVYTGV